MAIARGSICDPGATCATDVGHLVARIDGALGSAVLVGLDRLSTCRCGSPSLIDRPRREPWSYEDLRGVAIGQYGSLPVVLLELSHRSDPLPILILEPGQVGEALDGLVTLRRLIAASARAGSHAASRPLSPVHPETYS
jgi:hypothetical protein